MKPFINFATITNKTEACELVYQYVVERTLGGVAEQAAAEELRSTALDVYDVSRNRNGWDMELSVDVHGAGAWFVLVRLADRYGPAPAGRYSEGQAS